jgi:CheY-like chemotaxis protein
MDHSNYAGKKVLGTNVVRELRLAGFKGVIFIRSANDDLDAVQQFRAAGADGVLAKTGKVGDLALEVVSKCNLAWDLGVCNADGQP